MCDGATGFSGNQVRHRLCVNSILSVVNSGQRVSTNSPFTHPPCPAAPGTSRQNSLVWLIIDLTPDVSKEHIPVGLRSPVDAGTGGDVLRSLELSGALLLMVSLHGTCYNSPVPMVM